MRHRTSPLRVLTIMMMFAILPASIRCAPSGGFKITPIPADQTLREQVVLRDPGWISERVALIEISGILMNSHTPGLFSSGEHPVALAVENLEAAARDRRVKAVVLRINSPGGTVTASDAIYEEILAFKKKTGKPVIAYFQDVAASGAYYIACAADEIIAQRTTVTGSIGVIMQMVDVSKTMSMLGITADAIKSGAFKDAGSPLRNMKPEERAVFQGLVDNFYGQFVAVVDQGRPRLSREDVIKIADGRVYSAIQALELGLVDRIGTIHDAIGAAKERAGIKAAITVRYIRPLDWEPNVYARSPGGEGPVTINFLNLPGIVPLTNWPTFLYIWRVEG